MGSAAWQGEQLLARLQGCDAKSLPLQGLTLPHAGLGVCGQLCQAVATLGTALWHVGLRQGASERGLCGNEENNQKAL